MRNAISAWRLGAIAHRIELNVKVAMLSMLKRLRPITSSQPSADSAARRRSPPDSWSGPRSLVQARGRCSPAILRKDTLAIDVSSTSMKVAIDTTSATSQGLRSPAADRGSTSKRLAHASRRSSHLHRRHDRHAGADIDIAAAWSKTIFTGTRCTTFT